MNARLRTVWPILLLVPILLTACGSPVPGEPTPNPTPGKVIYGKATVESIQILILESWPVQVNVHVRGYLNDACTTLGQISQRQDLEKNIFWVEIATERPADMACAQVITAFEETISLDVYGLPAGTYTVDVNGVSATFTLASDNK